MILHKPLLANSTVRLTSRDKFINDAVSLANSAMEHRIVNVHPYRHLVYGEHIIIRPDASPNLLKLRGENITVEEIAIGLKRNANGTSCEFTGLLVIDWEGKIHQYSGIPAKSSRVFESNLGGWFKRHIRLVEEARRRAQQQE